MRSKQLSSFSAGRLLSVLMLILSGLTWPAPGSPAPVEARTLGPAVSAEETPVFRPLPGPKKKNRIDDTTYFTYEFNEKPKMGMVILKLQVFTKKGDKIAPFAIQGRSDMPSMRGAHDSGDMDFKLSRRNDYLLPLNIVMPGDWEVRLTFTRDQKPIFYASLTFHV